MAAPQRHYLVTEDDAGQRLDSFVAARMPRLSRAFVRKLCDGGEVLIDGAAAKAGRKIREGETINVNYDDSELDVVPTIDIPVLYEDADCIVLDKPAGILTHAPGRFAHEASVASFLRQHVTDITGERAGIVHRLDRATSGVIIGAKNQAALSFLQKQFADRKVRKTYAAVVEGHLDPPEAVVDMPIERNPKAPATFRVGPNGKPATTKYKVLEQGKAVDLVELQPETGRTHQLRVHMRQVGHPIVGDPLYGSGTFGDRLFLHALSLEITLPNREHQTFTAALPPEFAEQVQHA